MRTLALILTVAFLVSAATAQSSIPQPRFALEMRRSNGPPVYSLVFEHGGGYVFQPSLQFLPTNDSAPADQRKPTALKLETGTDGDSVVVTAFLCFGKYDTNDPPETKALPQEKIGTYRAKLGESIVLSEMKGFGVEPLMLTVVTPKAEISAPPTLSEVPSVTLEITAEDRAGYDLKLHNVSGREVTALAVVAPGQGDDRLEQHHFGRPLLRPDGTTKVRAVCARSGRMTPAGYQADNIPCRFVVSAALFSDGGYEGQASDAALLYAREIASAAQRETVRSVVDAILADTEADEPTKVSSIRERVSRISEDPDPALFERVWERFPGLPSLVQSRVRGTVKGALSSEKQNVSFFLREYERSLERRGHLSLAEYWAVWSKQ